MNLILLSISSLMSTKNQLGQEEDTEGKQRKLQRFCKVGEQSMSDGEPLLSSHLFLPLLVVYSGYHFR